MGALGFCSAAAVAEPWVGPGETGLRHDLQVLSDAGILRGPVMSWPIGWESVRRDLAAADAKGLSVSEAGALARVAARAHRELTKDDVDLQLSISLAADPPVIRTFDDTPRDEGDFSVLARSMGESRFVWRLEGTLAADPADGQVLRPDGSYLGVRLGNWLLSAGFVDRWWGPGWDGSLILSNNARPIPALAFDRLSTDPFDLPVLRWLGPWRLASFMGQLEGDRDFPDALLFGLRFELRPHPTLQLGFSRTAQWCGEGRPCGLSTFWDLLIGNDNDQSLEDQPGNQLAGFDLRWSWPGGRIPLAIYAQAIGEDEAGSLPSKYLGLFGLEAWGSAGTYAYRIHVEYADTACDFLNSPPEFGCAYTNVIYTDGYRYRDRVIGHAMDADGESIGVGMVAVAEDGHEWRALVREIKLNRAGASPRHSLVDGPARWREVSLRHERRVGRGVLSLGAGYIDLDADGDLRSGVGEGLNGFVEWRQRWH